MKLFPSIAALLVLGSFQILSAAGLRWETDFEAAKSKAAAEKKDLLLNFTGSDWCAWCIRLEKEVFDQDPFPAKASTDYIMVKLDYPRDTSGQSVDLREQNVSVQKNYAIDRFPTILLCDSDGRPYAATAYQAGGPQPYLDLLHSLRERKTQRDEAFSAANDLEGAAKAKALTDALSALELSLATVRNSYPEIVAAIQEADPADKTGFTASHRDDEAMQEFLGKLGALRSKGDIDGAVDFIDQRLSDTSVSAFMRRHFYGHKAGTLATAGRKTEAIEVLKEAVAKDPEPEKAEELRNFITILEKEIEAAKDKADLRD